MTEGLSLFGAFLAGLLSFFAPCCLPMVPVYLAYLAGERRVGEAGPEMGFLVRRAVLFTLGFTVVFVALGATATTLGRLLLVHRTVVRQAAGVLLVVFGLHLADLLRLGFLERGHMLVNSARTGGRKNAWWRPFVLGVVFSAGWQPCIGPVLGGILALAGTQENVRAGILLLFAYSLGLALPFIAAAAFLGRFRQRLPGLLARSEQRRRVSGYLLLLMGVLVFFNLFGHLSGWIPWSPMR
ncbi:MAG: cytochrome c biogenesis protein CcdA [Bacillota bacterium]|nr:cytochrome c biogenesis protein CcdA [Bacillota bacterium]